MTVALNNSIAAMTPELIEWRRDLHRNPELLYDLPRTSRIVAGRLRAFGFDEVIEGVAGTGILGVLHGANGPARAREKRALFRADMDALPIEEASGVDHASLSPGLMHACGHDGHTTMLLGAARLLAETRPFDGTLVFCFQPAEEGGARRAGDDRRRDAGALSGERRLCRAQLAGAPGRRVRASSGARRWPRPRRSTSRSRGPAAMPPCRIRFAIRSSARAHIVTAAQTIVSRVVDPLDNAVVSITSIHGGEAFNVIPDRVEMKGNIRTFSESGF